MYGTGVGWGRGHAQVTAASVVSGGLFPRVRGEGASKGAGEPTVNH